MDYMTIKSLASRALTPHLLRTGTVLAALVTLTACSVQLPSIRTAGGTPTPTPSTPVTLPHTAPTISTNFDPVTAAQVLLPSVGMIIVNSAGGGGGVGSGFVIQSSGNVSYMVTNNHVVEGASRVQVLMEDGSHWVAQIQGTDAIEDVAVIKIPAALPVVQFADSTKIQVGQPVVAIGSPLGNQGSVTAGIISALHRTLSAVGNGQGGSESLADVLQTDAPINPGNSGGPLADAAGHVIGMNAAGETSANSIGYAIPSAVVRRIAADLIAGKTAGHPYVGICFESIDQVLGSSTTQVEGFGDVVSGTVAGSPAAKAGLRTGDVIEQIDSTPLNNGQTLGGVLQDHNPGDTVQVKVIRSGSPTTIALTLGNRPAGGGGTCQP